MVVARTWDVTLWSQSPRAWLLGGAGLPPAHRPDVCSAFCCWCSWGSVHTRSFRRWSCLPEDPGKLLEFGFLGT